MSAELLALLWEATLAGSAALLLVLVLRRPVRAWLGASAAYALWMCVPVTLLAVMLPRGADVPLALPLVWQVVPAVVVTALPEPQMIWHWREWLFAFWLVGALASMAVLGWQQRHFHRGLGALRRRDDGLYQTSSATSGLPAVTGLLRPRILLPADFESRYTAQEQSLVIAHERLHVRRGDLAANALAALLACLFWFNPLLRWALRCFRLDQELACDERVIAGHPQARRSYGEAMLKTQFDPSPLPLGCHWQARHPLKERIDMLKRPTPSPLHWLSSVLLALAVTAATGYFAWAAQPASPSAAVDPTSQARMRDLPAGKQSNTPAAMVEQPATVESRYPPPAYPREAIRRGQSGQVVAVVEVDAQGVPTDVRIEHSEPSGVFDATTIATIRQWRFTPAMENGRAVPGKLRVPVSFDSGMTEFAGPAGVNRAEDYRWFRVDPDKVSETICDVLNVHKEDPHEVHCGIRKEQVGR